MRAKGIRVKEIQTKEIQKKDQMYALLQETALTQQKLISIYESGSGKKD